MPYGELPNGSIVIETKGTVLEGMGKPAQEYDCVSRDLGIKKNVREMTMMQYWLARNGARVRREAEKAVDAWERARAGLLQNS